MSPNIKIQIYQIKSIPSFKLSGDFDKTLANRLIYIMTKKSNRIPKILIHPNYGNHMYPFGLERI
jgi:hypothetical protein